jgi:hypothetical protein
VAAWKPSVARVGGDRYRFACSFVFADDIEAPMVGDDVFYVRDLVPRHDEEPGGVRASRPPARARLAKKRF